MKSLWKKILSLALSIRLGLILIKNIDMKYKLICSFLYCFCMFCLSAQNISSLNLKLIDQTVQDKLSPPLSSRVLAYCNLAYYYGLHYNDNQNLLINKISKSRGVNLSVEKHNLSDTEKLNFATNLFIETAQLFAYNDLTWTDPFFIELTEEDSLVYLQLKTNLFHLIETDGFKERNSNGYYNPSEGFYSYQLTPPTYDEPIEKNWEHVKTFYVQNIDKLQFENELQNGEISQKKFLIQNKKIIKKTKKLKNDDFESALLWDCNPVRIENVGHVKKVNFRMTPAAHWVSILIDIEKENIDDQKLSEQLTSLSIALFDAFIVVWKNKYDTDFIRPVTFINRELKDTWSPLLDTPIFPEFPSGHSTVSMLAAQVLTEMYGENYVFVDSTQYKYCQIAKTFNSFEEAALDAGLSRYYGGIHYMDAINKGFQQGKDIYKMLQLWFKED